MWSLGQSRSDARQDPSRLIGRRLQPLLTPLEEERNGDRPNVVCSCGGLVPDGQLVPPDAAAERASRIALVDLADLPTAIADSASRPGQGVLIPTSGYAGSAAPRGAPCSLTHL